MNININQFTAISVSTLTEGMQINYSIYCEKGNDYVLLCNDTVLTAELIHKFKLFTAPNYNIYIPNEHYQSYLELSGALSKPVTSAIYEGYAELKRETADLLDRISEENTVPSEVTEAISQTIHIQLETVDIARIIQSLNSVRNIDEYLHAHCSNVALLNGLIGKWMGLDTEDQQILIKTGLLHDIGKLKIPSDILNKPAKLTKEEFEIVKAHPVYSFQILVDSGVTDRRILLGALQHHEKVNGLGYPRGLPMEQITEVARITSISDIYDAMVAKRVYKKAHSPFEILAWFAEGCYSDLDIHFVNLFLDCMTEELKGKNMLLSNGAIGCVMYVDPKAFMYPIVQIGEAVVQTTPELHCVSLYMDE